MGAASALVMAGCSSSAEPTSRIEGERPRGADAGPGETWDGGASHPGSGPHSGEIDGGSEEEIDRPSPITPPPLDPDDPLLGGEPPLSAGAGCGKIDFLFVIDNSGSMQDEQENLIRSFPGFIDTIRSSVAASDHHVLVTDTDASGGGTSSSASCSGDACTCTPAASCCPSVCASRPGGTCNGSPCSNLASPSAECDQRLGAGRVRDSQGTRCIPDGPRFLNSSTPDLSDKFSCMASVGTSGDGNERPMQAISEAVGVLARPGECNEGFLRDDAILVVTFITDEEEDPGKSPGDPRDWMADLVAAKNGNEKSVVVLGVFGDSDRQGSTCAPGGLMGNLGADPGYRLRAFVEEFEYGVAGSVCASDYAPLFDKAVEVIDSACDAFTL
jgi:hypothetical protein